MKITVKLHDGKEKNFEITAERVVRVVTMVGVYGFVKKEVNRVRPPKRNIGLLLNDFTAAAITDAILKLTFAKEVGRNNEPEVVEEAEFSEVKEEDKEVSEDGTK